LKIIRRSLDALNSEITFQVPVQVNDRENYFTSFPCNFDPIYIKITKSFE
jgi:hypothetical protein